MVKIRTREDVLQTLDSDFKLDGCQLTDKMCGCCSAVRRVTKVVRNVFDEHESRMYETRAPLYILENMICDGKVQDFEHRCDHCCQLLWHEEWLKRAEGEEDPMLTEETSFYGGENLCGPDTSCTISLPEVCQLRLLDGLKRQNSSISNLLQFRIKLLWSTKTKASYLVNRLKSITSSYLDTAETSFLYNNSIKQGDTVRVLNREEINKSLDLHNKYNKCQFINEMYKYCDNDYIVLKEIKYFYDEAKRKMCKCKDIFLLQDVTCSGERRAFSKPCDRHCYYFWHKKWIRKIK